MTLPPTALRALRRGVVIPAHPLALTSRRTLDERYQRALTRYYVAAGAGGIAVGVHTTQFAIRQAGLLDPVLALAAETLEECGAARDGELIRVAGLLGRTRQAVREARLAVDLGYHLGLLSFAAFPEASDADLLNHARAVAEVIPLMGFYLQPAVGGRRLSFAFWRRFAAIEGVVAIKVAPFDRYETAEVARAIVEAGRDREVVLYTGNDDHIVEDLLTPHRPARPGGGLATVRMVGGLLGHWAFWTRSAVALLERIQVLRRKPSGPIPSDLLRLAGETTAANAAIFDAANGFRGCLPGIHEILRRQGLLRGVWCLDPSEVLSPGQRRAIDRVCRAYPHLGDDDFVRTHRDTWLA